MQRAGKAHQSASEKPEIMTRTYTPTETAAAVRKTLRETYGIKFSVRIGPSYGSIRITYTDGPTEQSLQQLTAEYRAAPWSATRIIVHREISDDFRARGLALIEHDNQNQPMIREGKTAYVPQTPFQTTQDVALAWCRTHPA